MKIDSLCVHDIADVPPSARPAWAVASQAHARRTARQLGKNRFCSTRQLGEAQTFILTILENKMYIGKYIRTFFVS